DTADFRCERIELVDHRVDGIFQPEDFAFDVDRNLPGQISTSDGRCHVRDVADLAGEVRGHRIHVVGEIFPGSGAVRRHPLTARLAVGTDFAGNTGDFGSECVELVDHRIDRVLQFQNLALHVDRDFSRKIAAGDGGRHFRDVPNLVGEVLSHGIYVVGEIL